MTSLLQALLNFLQLCPLRIFQLLIIISIISGVAWLVRSLANHIGPFSFPSITMPIPPLKPYNEPLEVAHSRIHHALEIDHALPSHLLTSLNLKLSTPWIEPPPSWRLKEAVKLSQLRRREHRNRYRNPFPKRQPIEYTPVRVGKSREAKTRKRSQEESVHRIETQHKIWSYEILILNGKAKNGEHPGIGKEAKKRYEELMERMRGESEEMIEDFVREEMEGEVDAGREFGIEWEVWRLVLELFLERLQKEELESERMRLVIANDAICDEEKGDYARCSILKRLFVEDLVLKPKEWKEMLREQIKYIEGLERDARWGLAETRAIVRELEGFREGGGFPRGFVARYGRWVVRGDLSLSERNRREIGEDMVRLRNANAGW